MRAIAPRLILGCTSAAEREVSFSLKQIAFGIDDLNGSFNANGAILF